MAISLNAQSVIPGNITKFLVRSV